MAPVDIHSQESRDLLDIIDKLRSEGLGGYVNLPQIIVCGDQSSGKSSVLEAISGLSFPSKDNLCTRFATELILRRDSEAKVDVSIIPHQSRCEAEKVKLESFTAELDPDNADIGAVIENAKIAMGLDDETSSQSGKRFSDDVLRIQLSGPKQQLLTLVDLPGLFQAGNSQQSTDEAPIVKKLVLDYMRNDRSIILATVSAATDFATQGITRYSRQVDPRGLRTMGLITKPDKLDAGSDSESSYVKLASNQDVVLKLGWHVLKNRGFGQQKFTSAERDANEMEFFADSEREAWTAVDRTCLGVGNLRSRLSDVLHRQIVQQLPSMLLELQTKLRNCDAELKKLGTSRQTVFEQKQYLTRISSKFTGLIQAAVDGNYTDVSFFGTATALPWNDEDDVSEPSISAPKSPGKEELSHPWDDEDDVSELPISAPKSPEEEMASRRLRAVVQTHLTKHHEELQHKGHTRRIVEAGGKKGSGSGDILRDDYIHNVKAIISHSRGQELPGLFNPLVVGDLFRDQSKKWKHITDKWVSAIVEASVTVIKFALEASATPDTASMILANIITPDLETLKSATDIKLSMLHSAHAEIHPITYNHYLTENVQRARQDRILRKMAPVYEKITADHHFTSQTVRDHVKSALDAVKEPDMEKVAASDAIDYMQAYYKVALKRYSDDVSLLAIEQCLISKLPGLFTPEVVYDMSDEEVESMAKESDASVAERKRLVAKRELFQKGIQDLGRFARI